MKYGKTNPKTERKVMAIFWSIAAMAALLLIFHLKSVRVDSVKRIDEENGAAVFVVDVVNPTKDVVSAKLCLTICTSGGDGTTMARFTRNHLCQVPANNKVSTEIRLEPNVARFLKGTHSVRVCDVDVKN